jgi:uncharacterized protein (TIGR02271 family)
MTHTVIGIFDKLSEAQHAVDQLVNGGLMRNNIDISSQNTASDSMNSSSDNKFSNFFGSLFDKDDDVRNYSQVANRGSVVTVHAQSEQEAQLAADVLDRAGAVDVDERAMQYQSTTNTGATYNTTDQALPVIEEQLQVGKREVTTGGVRLHSRIIERPVEEHLRLREEHVHVERNPVNRAASPADLENFQEGVIELREQAEVPVVSKEARVVEEVSLTKEVEEREEVVKDTLRNTDVEVENFKGNTVTGVNEGQNLTGGNTVLDSDSEFLDKSHQGWTSALRRMKEVEDDYKVADDDPDVRGWDVVDSTGNKIGEVDELIVDTDAMKVRYLEIDVDNSLVDADDHHILLPIGSATLDHSNKNVTVSTLNSGSLANYPAYNGETISRDYEHKLLTALSPGYKAGSVDNDRFYEGDHFDGGRFYGSRSL